MAKKLISVLLIFLLALNSFGFYLVFGFLILDCKVEAVEIAQGIRNLEKADVTAFKFSSSEVIPWTDENEIKLSGHLYDVVKKEQKPAGVYLFCVADEREDKISSEFHSFINNENNSAAKNINVLSIEKLFKNFLYPNFTFQQNPVEDNQLSLTVNSFYLSPQLKIPLPPPKAAAVKV